MPLAMKYIKIRKVGFRNYQEGFEFIKYARCENVSFEYTEEKELLMIKFNLQETDEVTLEYKLISHEYKSFMKKWKLFLLNEDYFFDLADFNRK
jgi:hypothetical protein